MMTKDVPLIEAYRRSVVEFRRCYAALHDADRKANRQGFGNPINVVDLRHAIANPNEGGAIHDL